MVKIENNSALNERDTPRVRKTQAAAVVKQLMSKRSGRPNRKEFLRFLDDLRNKMQERGLTEEILQDILNNEE